jgi:hypothetical protein
MKQFDLSESFVYSIEDDNGNILNVIEISEGGVRMQDASCADRTCVRHGYLRKVPIVCLPNRVVVRYLSGNGMYDAISK